MLEFAGVLVDRTWTGGLMSPELLFPVSSWSRVSCLFLWWSRSRRAVLLSVLGAWETSEPESKPAWPLWAVLLLCSSTTLTREATRPWSRILRGVRRGFSELLR